MTLQLARFVEIVKRKFDKKRFTGAVFFYVAKAFCSLWIEGFFCKVTILDFPVKIIISYLHFRTFVASFQATNSSCQPRAGWCCAMGM